LTVRISRCAGNDYNFVAILSEKSVLNGPSMDSTVSRMSLLALHSIVFVGIAAER
jgi:hypothetical protein